MTLVRLQPFRNVNTLQHQMDRLFNNLVELHEATDDSNVKPAAEMYVDEANIYLQLEVPGLAPDEIEVQVNAYSVIINGERKEATIATAQSIKKSEFRYGKVHRTVDLPEKVQIDSVQAKYENGILKLTLPKVEDEVNKTVKVIVES
jgi:HSP20 family protein